MMDPKKITLDQVIDIPSAAVKFKLSEAYLRALVKRGRIEAFSIGRNVLVLTDSVRDYTSDRFVVPEGHMTVSEAAEAVGVHTQTIHHWIRTGHVEGHAHRVGNSSRWTVTKASMEGKTKRKRGRPSNKAKQPEQLSLFDITDYDNDKALHPVE